MKKRHNIIQYIAMGSMKNKPRSQAITNSEENAAKISTNKRILASIIPVSIPVSKVILSLIIYQHKNNYLT